jgi:putative transposase
VPGLPHHVTQRGNRREPVFFGGRGLSAVPYRQLIAAAARRAGAEIWAYCLMPNHVHLIVTPTDQDGLRATFAEAHRRYTAQSTLGSTGRAIYFRAASAVVIEEPHLLAAVRYIALNPVAAGLVIRAEDWPWSSARAHLAGADDELARVAPLRALISDFAALLTAPADPATTARIERAPTIGRLLGAPEWIAALERQLGRCLATGKPGPKTGPKVYLAPASGVLRDAPCRALLSMRHVIEASRKFLILRRPLSGRLEGRTTSVPAREKQTAVPEAGGYSSALTISSHIFLASPNSIIVLLR